MMIQQQGGDQNQPMGNQQMPQVPDSPQQPQSCIRQGCTRQGCTNPAIVSSDWEDEYCSNECVITHCR